MANQFLEESMERTPNSFNSQITETTDALDNAYHITFKTLTLDETINKQIE